MSFSPAQRLIQEDDAESSRKRLLSTIPEAAKRVKLDSAGETNHTQPFDYNAVPAYEISLDELRVEEYQQRQQQQQATAFTSTAASSSSSSSSSAAAAANSPGVLYRNLRFQSTSRDIPLSFESYPTDWFPFAPNNFVCAICLGIARDPPNLESCAHLMCRACVVDLQRSSKSRGVALVCPSCKVSFDGSAMRSMPFVQQTLSQLAVRCPYHESGCEWSSSNFGTDGRNLIAHGKQCEFRTIRCRACWLMMKKQEEEKHQLECMQRLVQCASCSESVCFSDFARHQPASLAGKNSATEEQPMDETRDSIEEAAAAAVAALLPPFVPPCIRNEICVNGCEDVRHPGHVSVHLRSGRAAHSAVCTHRRVRCTLCLPDHLVEHQLLAAHLHSRLAQADINSFAMQSVA